MTEKYLQSESVYLQTIDAVHVVLNEKSGNCFLLNEVGKKIFDFIQKPKTKRQIELLTANLYQQNPELCREPVALYLTMLKERGLIDKK